MTELLFTLTFFRNNEISILPAAVFAYMPNLIMIDLSSNKLNNTGMLNNITGFCIEFQFPVCAFVFRIKLFNIDLFFKLAMWPVIPFEFIPVLWSCYCLFIDRSKTGHQGRPHPGFQILSISCSF